ncbi:MAG: hypothetical protein IPL49_09095 [Saprospirales bacterium]|nr:hypothetical protein [Saprospirales bacterium]
MLNIVVGLVLVFLLYSLFATTILELLASFLAFRGKNLEKALRNMLDGDNTGLFQEFKESPMYQQLAGRFIGKSSPPSYLTSEKFRSILFHVIGKNQDGNEVENWIDRMPDSPLKSVLQQLKEDAQHDKEAFKQKVELWFNDVMDRASGWYKRQMQRILIVLGLGIAISFNVDSLQIYGQLSRDPETANKIALEAAKVVEGQEAADEPLAMKKELYELVNANLEELKSPLGIGWAHVTPATMTWQGWLHKAFGWLVTAIAISLGAPFWFDMLRKMVNIRSSGKAVDGNG